MTKFYTGVGSRDIDSETYKLLTLVGERMSEKGYVLRSGGSTGADMAFQEGCCKVDPEQTEIWLPDRDFNREKLAHTKFSGSNYAIPTETMYDSASDWLYENSIVKNLDGKAPKAKNLLRRNLFQVVGNIDPLLKPKDCLSKVVIYATDEKKIYSKGTRVAVWSARHFGVPTYNLLLDDQREKLLRLLKL